MDKVVQVGRAAVEPVPDVVGLALAGRRWQPRATQRWSRSTRALNWAPAAVRLDRPT